MAVLLGESNVVNFGSVKYLTEDPMDISEDFRLTVENLPVPVPSVPIGERGSQINMSAFMPLFNIIEKKRDGWCIFVDHLNLLRIVVSVLNKKDPKIAEELKSFFSAEQVSYIVGVFVEYAEKTYINSKIVICQGRMTNTKLWNQLIKCLLKVQNKVFTSGNTYSVESTPSDLLTRIGKCERPNELDDALLLKLAAEEYNRRCYVVKGDAFGSCSPLTLAESKILIVSCDLMRTGPDNWGFPFEGTTFSLVRGKRGEHIVEDDYVVNDPLYKTFNPNLFTKVTECLRKFKYEDGLLVVERREEDDVADCQICKGCGCDVCIDTICEFCDQKICRCQEICDELNGSNECSCEGECSCEDFSDDGEYNYEDNCGDWSDDCHYEECNCEGRCCCESKVEHDTDGDVIMQ